MKETKQETILFSCLGSTDPVRGEHDGPMLHIARHYRPDKILWYLTKEMQMINEKDHRYELAIDCLKKQCPGYEPEILPPCYSSQEDVSDFDGFYDAFYEELLNLSRRYPNAEILVNLSSGTPQMKVTLALLSSTLQFPIRAIQVKNFEKRSGTSERTTSKNYELEYELELNEDAEPGAPCRCSEPQLMLIQRNKRRAQVDSLLQHYDYAALLDMRETLPETVMPLIQHLANRCVYNPAAYMQAKGIREIELYPAGAPNAASYPVYRELSEYTLVLKLMQCTGRYTDLVIRLNPLIIRLQKSWLEKEGDVDFSRFGYRDHQGEMIMDPEKIYETAPDFAKLLNARYESRGGFRKGPLNIVFCNYMAEWLKKAGTKQGVLFQNLEKLNKKRNESAHNLKNVTEEEIQKILGYSSSRLIEELIDLLRIIYPQHYRKELFSIYDTANHYILEQL